MNSAPTLLPCVILSTAAAAAAAARVFYLLSLLSRYHTRHHHHHLPSALLPHLTTTPTISIETPTPTVFQAGGGATTLAK